MNTFMHKRRKFFILFPIAFIFGIGSVVMLLWNWLLPVLFGLPLISYWQAVGLLALSRILFGNFGFGKQHHKPPFANSHFREKMMNMTEEEKQKFKEEWKQRCA